MRVIDHWSVKHVVWSVLESKQGVLESCPAENRSRAVRCVALEYFDTGASTLNTNSFG